MSAALLLKLQATGAALRAEGGELVLAAPEEVVAPALLAELRAAKHELLALLRGDRCRFCGGPMAWPEPCGVVYGDGTAAHHGCRLLAAGGRFPSRPGDLRRPILFLFGDDAAPLADGPEGFHRPTLRKALGSACFVGLVPAAPDRTFYGRAMTAALEHRRPAVVVETQRQERDAWLRVLARHTKVPVELCGEAPGRA